MGCPAAVPAAVPDVRGARRQSRGCCGVPSRVRRSLCGCRRGVSDGCPGGAGCPAVSGSCPRIPVPLRFPASGSPASDCCAGVVPGSCRQDRTSGSIRCGPGFVPIDPATAFIVPKMTNPPRVRDGFGRRRSIVPDRSRAVAETADRPRCRREADRGPPAVSCRSLRCRQLLRLRMFSAAGTGCRAAAGYLRASFASMHSVAWGTFIRRSLGIRRPVVLQMP